MKRILLVGLLVFAVTSCGKKVFEPLYTKRPAIESIPKVTKVKLKVVPLQETKELFVNLLDKKKPNPDNFHNNPGVKYKLGKPPSIIIAVPQEVSVSEKKSIEYKEIDKVFRTDGYFNEAEQTIEQALLRKGFNVLARSKFEAKLRDLRDRANSKPWFWNDWVEKLLESGEYEVVKEEYKNQFQEGTITAMQYTEVISEIEKYRQEGVSGKNRKEDEMNDIAEVIRAAQTGSDRVDYLLQINELSIAAAGESMISIQDSYEVTNFMRENEGLSFGSLPTQLPVSISSNWLRAVFNAKLIEIKTGSIVWLGSHEIASHNATKIRVLFTIQKYVSNGEAVNKKIDDYNNELLKLKSDLEGISKDLASSYVQASKKRKFESSEEMNSYKKRLIARISELESSFSNKTALLKERIENSPQISNNPWEYAFTISKPILIPTIIAKDDTAQGKQKLIRHRKTLIKTLVKDLIETIEIIK